MALYNHFCWYAVKQSCNQSIRSGLTWARTVMGKWPQWKTGWWVLRWLSWTLRCTFSEEWSKSGVSVTSWHRKIHQNYGKLKRRQNRYSKYTRWSPVNVACCYCLSVLNSYRQPYQRIWRHISLCPVLGITKTTGTLGRGDGNSQLMDRCFSFSMRFRILPDR